MQKIVCLYKRNDDHGVEDFHAILTQIASDDADIPTLTRYVQSHTLVQGYRKGELLFDALEEFWFESGDIARRFLDSAVYQNMIATRASHIDRAKGVVMIVDVYRVKNGPVPIDAVKNIEFVNRRPTVELAQFRRYWRDVHGPLASKIPSILRYEQDHLALDQYRNGVAPRYDGLAITWFSSTAAMREGATTKEYEITREDEMNFLPDGHLPIIIAREAIER